MTVIVVAAFGISAICTATFHIRAEYRGPRWQVYLFKPLTTLLILAIALLIPPSASTAYRLWIALGLLFSLAGDIFLMLPADRFVPGLVSFLIAHLCYIAAFTTGVGFQWPLVGLAPLLLLAIPVLARIWPRLGKLRTPVLCYMGVILVMGWQAFGRWQVLGTLGAWLALCGAWLFVISDSLLALRRFGGTFRTAQALILSTYYAAQLLIALSVGL
ncbi:MAG: lysoplasmalogenase [Caldilineaceae bacterium]|nr:lysoplasmalogenase [Caldilineaceae bacterium]